MADADPGSGGPGPPDISSLKENFNQQQVRNFSHKNSFYFIL